MFFRQDPMKIQQRFDQLLQGEADFCCVRATSPKDPRNPYQETPEATESWYMDAERIVQRNVDRFEKTYYTGDALPFIFLNFGTGGHVKYFSDNIQIDYRPDTIWFQPFLESCADLQPADLAHSRHFQREMEIIRYAVAQSRGRYFVGMPDNCGSLDALAHMRGSNDLLMDFLDEPEDVKRAASLCVDCLRQASDRMFDAVKDNCLGGSCHGWMSFLTSKRAMQLQCDLSVMLSPEMYGEFVMPELSATLDSLDHGIYHIDGQEQIRHLDLLLSEPRLRTFQWTNVASQPPILQNIPTLKKIQAAGRSLVLFLTKQELKPLLDQLEPRGLILNISGASCPEESDDIVRYVERATLDMLRSKR